MGVWEMRGERNRGRVQGGVMRGSETGTDRCFGERGREKHGRI